MISQRITLLKVVVAGAVIATLELTALAQPAVASDREVEARAHFEKGVELLEKDAWADALTEFLASRRSYPTVKATTNAVISLRRLGRYDEALDLIDALLREFSDLGAETKLATESEAAELAKLVGVIVIDGAEPGAALTIDGRERGLLPLAAPSRVCAGSRVVRVSKEAFAPFEMRIEVAAEQTVHVAAKLRPLPKAARMPTPVPSTVRRFSLALDGAAWIAPSFGGDVAEGCKGTCSASFGLGGYGVLRGGYAITPRVSAGLGIGFLAADQAIAGRAAKLYPVGYPDKKPSRDGAVTDTLKLRGATAEVWAGAIFGERPFLHLRLGAGAVLGWVGDTRSGAFEPGGANYPVGPDGVTPFAAFVYVAPEVQVGLHVSEHVALTAGVSGMVLFGLSNPMWGTEKEIATPSDGNATYAAETLFGGVAFGVSPSVGARYEF